MKKRPNRDRRIPGNKRSAEGRSEKPNSERASDRSSGAFSFKDRSGKVHTFGSGGGGGRSEPRGGESRAEFRKPDGRRDAKKDRDESPRGRRDDRPAGRGRDSGRFESIERSSEHSSERDTRRGRGRFEEQRESSGGFKRPGRPSGRSGKGGGGRFERPDRSSFRPRGRNRDTETLPIGKPTEKPAKELRATIEKNARGFAFLVFDNRDYEDAFVNPRDADRFFHGDRVRVGINADGDVIGVEVVEHRFRELVGKLHRFGKNAVVVFERRKTREEIRLQKDDPKAQVGDWVRIQLHYSEEEGRGGLVGEILEIYGATLPASADISMIAAEFSVYEQHTAEAVKEAESFRLDLADTNREDLTHIPFITIDGETARDFDDAVFVERDGSDHILWVAIADVSHYVRPGIAIDREAYQRGTSVYFPEKAFHMLPKALSENLCSLRPNEKRLTMTAKIRFDSRGEKKSVEVMNSIIESRRRATYTEIFAEAEQHGKDKNWEYAAHLELYRVLRKRRNSRGSIDFDLPEADIRVDANGEPTEILRRNRNDAHRLIEEFMIAANEAVTEWALERELPFVYRVHEEPSEKALEKFQELCWHSGVELKLDSKNVTHSLQKLVEQIANHPAQSLLNMALLRSMRQAHYTSTHDGHFGLASLAYTHFTSPIRRYPDLLVHRMLKRGIELERGRQSMQKNERDEHEAFLEEASEHCSYRERLAAEAERESNRLKQVRILLKHLGENLSGKITGMNEKGVYVTLDEPFVEGMVPASELGSDDYYEFIEERLMFVGRRRKKTFKIGDTVEVIVAKADIETRQIDLRVVSPAGAPEEGQSSERRPARPERSERPGRRDRGERSDRAERPAGEGGRGDRNQKKGGKRFDRDADRNDRKKRKRR